MACRRSVRFTQTVRPAAPHRGFRGVPKTYPPKDQLVGPRRVVEVKQLLAMTHLLTLTGAGG